MSEHTDLFAELDLIEAFGFWLKHTLPGWSISKPAIERTAGGKPHLVFILYQDSATVGVYESPIEALARIGNDQLTAKYVSLISGANEEDESPGGSGSWL